MIALLLAVAAAATTPPASPSPPIETWVVVASVRSGRATPWYHDYCRKSFYERGSVEDYSDPYPAGCMTHGGEIYDVRLDDVEVLQGPAGKPAPRRIGLTGHALVFNKSWGGMKPGTRLVAVLSTMPAKVSDATGLPVVTRSWSHVEQMSYACLRLPDDVAPGDGRGRVPLEKVFRDCYDLHDLRQHYLPEPDPEVETP